MQQEISAYYNKLAATYDSDRFGSTYGKYIDYQEKKIVRKLLKSTSRNNILDMACGTGRFLEFANNGIDASGEMLKVAQGKYPECELFEESVTKTRFPNNTFDTILSFHLIMHLDKEKTEDFLKEAYRILRPDGKLIFDFPSKYRRKLVNYKEEGWHGANGLTVEDIKEISKDWKICQYYGILFFPIHRFPKGIRNLFRQIDTWLCHSFLRKYASYLIIVLEKK